MQEDLPGEVPVRAFLWEAAQGVQVHGTVLPLPEASHSAATGWLAPTSWCSDVNCGQQHCSRASCCAGPAALVQISSRGVQFSCSLVESPFAFCHTVADFASRWICCHCAAFVRARIIDGSVETSSAAAGISLRRSVKMKDQGLHRVGGSKDQPSGILDWCNDFCLPRAIQKPMID